MAIRPELCSYARPGDGTRRDFHVWSIDLPSFPGASWQQPVAGAAISDSLVAVVGNDICGYLLSRWFRASEPGPVFVLLRPGGTTFLVQFSRDRKPDAGWCADPDCDLPFTRILDALSIRSGVGGTAAIVQTDCWHGRIHRTRRFPGGTGDPPPLEGAPGGSACRGCPRRVGYRRLSPPKTLGAIPTALLPRHRRFNMRLYG